MTDFYEIWQRRGSVTDKLAVMLEAREAAREQELKAATDITRAYRGKVGFLPPVYCIHRAYHLPTVNLTKPHLVSMAGILEYQSEC